MTPSRRWRAPLKTLFFHLDELAYSDHMARLEGQEIDRWRICLFPAAAAARERHVGVGGRAVKGPEAVLLF